MTLLIINHNYHYEMENICRLFFPFAKINIQHEPADGDDIVILTELIKETGCTKVFVRVKINGKILENSDTIANDDLNYVNECERRMAIVLYLLLAEFTQIFPKWGILTGVRPGKLMRRLVEENNADEARQYFTERLLVSEEKTNLCMETATREDKIISLSKRNAFSLYIAVPFCPSRCAYCSFVSHSVEKSFRLVEDYVNLLREELVHTGKIAKECGLFLQTVYIGGGTPTVLSAAQLSDIMDTVKSNFDLSGILEYTVEAGRPDTVTKEKLFAIKTGGATRISINPQTMNDTVLENIGRRHTSQQTIDAFLLARECGFGNINMDLIAGLPGDSPESFSRTLDEILKLDPENVTVHTLSLKRSSNMTGAGDLPNAEDGAAADQMLTEAQSRLTLAGHHPYYLYRQSKTVGNLENTGYAKPGFEGLYNIYMMDETHTILACGASAVTKLKSENGYIERIFNFKYPYEYISRFAEMLKRKEKVAAFYEKYAD